MCGWLDIGRRAALPGHRAAWLVDRVKPVVLALPGLLCRRLGCLPAFAHCGLDRFMGDTTITKVDSTHSPRGPLGQTYLATGVGVGMRLWRDRPPGEAKPQAARDYETVGYVISGRAELHSEGQMVLLEPGDCWVVPRHARHTYKILEPFTAIEATHPPAEIHDRDHPAGQ